MLHFLSEIARNEIESECYIATDVCPIFFQHYLMQKLSSVISQLNLSQCPLELEYPFLNVVSACTESLKNCPSDWTGELLRSRYFIPLASAAIGTLVSMSAKCLFGQRQAPPQPNPLPALPNLPPDDVRRPMHCRQGRIYEP